MQAENVTFKVLYTGNLRPLLYTYRTVDVHMCTVLYVCIDANMELSKYLQKAGPFKAKRWLLKLKAVIFPQDSNL